MTDKKTERVLQDIVELRPPSPASVLPITEETVSSGVEPEGSGSSESSLSSVVVSGSEGSASSSDHTVGEKNKAPEAGGYSLPEAAPVPTQEGPHGLRYDFNAGIRVRMPEGEQWRLRFWDAGTETCLYDGKQGEGDYICSRKKYFMQGVIELFDGEELVWTHHFDAKGKKVAVILPVGTLGDPLGWIPYAERFAQQHECEMTIVASEVICQLMGPAYPDMKFIQESKFNEVREEFYASYYIGLFFRDEEREWQPRDFRAVGLHRTAGWILGVDPTEIRPKVHIEEADTRPIEEPYVVVAVQASCACKMWHNPFGWLDTVGYLKKLGYRVICIDKDPVVGWSCHWNCLPHGVEDETGERPLTERARWLKHAEFFVGLSSGLSWLAWAVGTPVVMISGFTDPINEFQTPYRVFSVHGCNSCWHDIRTPFQHDDYLFCPRHKGTPRAFECTRNINTAYVIDTIKRLCRDHGYKPPVLSETQPDDLVEATDQLMKQKGYEVKHQAYWKL